MAAITGMAQGIVGLLPRLVVIRMLQTDAPPTLMNAETTMDQRIVCIRLEGMFIWFPGGLAAAFVVPRRVESIRNSGRVQPGDQLVQQGGQLRAERAQGCRLSTAVEELAVVEIVRMDLQVDADVRGDLVQPPALLGRERAAPACCAASHSR